MNENLNQLLNRCMHDFNLMEICCHSVLNQILKSSQFEIVREVRTWCERGPERR